MGLRPPGPEEPRAMGFTLPIGLSVRVKVWDVEVRAQAEIPPTQVLPAHCCPLTELAPWGPCHRASSLVLPNWGGVQGKGPRRRSSSHGLRGSPPKSISWRTMWELERPGRKPQTREPLMSIPHFSGQADGMGDPDMVGSLHGHRVPGPRGPSSSLCPPPQGELHKTCPVLNGESLKERKPGGNGGLPHNESHCGWAPFGESWTHICLSSFLARGFCWALPSV